MTAVEPLQAEYVNQRITDARSRAGRPRRVIGTVKELTETVCKAILVARTGARS